jgi:hypothetical protein
MSMGIQIAMGVGVGGGAPTNPLLPFTDNFLRADGAIGNGWTGASWTIVSNAVINTPALGSDLAVNGTFAVDANWTKGTGWTIASGVATHTGASGGGITQAILTANNWYRIDWTLSNWSAGAFFGRPGNQVQKGRAANGTYVDALFTTGSTAGIVAGSNGAGDVDNVSFKQITLTDLFIARNFARADVDISVKGTSAGGPVWGVVLNLDSTSSPANYVAALHDGTNAYLIKCVAGTITQLISVAATYSAGTALRVTKTGTTYQLFYNAVQRGSDTTISDAGVISNTLHGMVNSYSGNTLDDFSIAAF